MSTENLIRKLAGRTPKFLDNDKIVLLLLSSGATVSEKDVELAQERLKDAAVIEELKSKLKR